MIVKGAGELGSVVEWISEDKMENEKEDTEMAESDNQLQVCAEMCL